MGRPIVDLTDQIFGRLKVLKRDNSKPQGQGKSVYWLCQCQCGNIKSVRTDKLRNGDIQSCGCLQKESRGKAILIDLTNQSFGKLIVIERDLTKPTGKNCPAYWTCKCECGNIVSVRSDHLRDGTTSSCGCINSCGEERISKILQSENIDYTTQYEFSDLKGDFNNLRFDFAIFEKEKLKCLIEFQGSQHYKKWGNETEERFQKRLEYDQKKRNYCKYHNINLIEIPYTEYNQLNWTYLKSLIFGN